MTGFQNAMVMVSFVVTTGIISVPAAVPRFNRHVDGDIECALFTYCLIRSV